MKNYYVYIMTNKGRTTLYTGVTSSLVRRVTQHRRGDVPGFTQRYNINRLMHYERFNDVRDAIAREKQIKGWSRTRKEALIGESNPKWTDLSVTVLGLDAALPAKWRERRGWWDGDSSPPAAARNDILWHCHPERSEGSLCDPRARDSSLRSE
jgi:putative endonuclease